MNTLRNQLVAGWKSVRWQRRFVTAFLPLSLLVALAMPHDARQAPSGFIWALFGLAAFASLLWSGMKEGSDSPLAKPTLVVLLTGAFLIVVLRIITNPRPTISVSFPFGKVRFMVSAQKIGEEAKTAASTLRNPLKAYDFKFV